MQFLFQSARPYHGCEALLPVLKPGQGLSPQSYSQRVACSAERSVC